MDDLYYSALDPIVDGSYLHEDFTNEGDVIHQTDDLRHPDGCSCLICGMHFGAGFLFGFWS